MQRIEFTSDALPATLDDRARFALWRDVFTSAYRPLDLFRAEDRPFSLRFQFTRLGEAGLGMLEGTVNRFSRTLRHVAASQNDDFVLGLNRGRSDLVISHVGRESTLRPGMRLARAHRLLAGPRYAAWTITTIALEAGFGDLSTFNHAFRRAYGMSPSDVRVKARREDWD